MDLACVGADNMIRFGEQYDFVGLVVVDNVVVLAHLLCDILWLQWYLAAWLDGCHMVCSTGSVASIVFVVSGLSDWFSGENRW